MSVQKPCKVLIALDFYSATQKVAEEGYSIAKAMNANVVLLHTLAKPMNFNTSKHITILGFSGYPETKLSNLKIDNLAALREVAQTYLNKSKLHLGDKTIETIIKEGDPAESILDVANELKVNLIILGSHSQKWMENILMGSVTEKVLRLTQVPLCIIPTRKPV